MPAQRRLPASTRHPLHPVRRLWVCACVAVVAVCAAADVWQGPYHQEGHRGHTVEFEGSRYAIRTHDGRNFMEDYRVLDVVTNILGDATSSPVVVELP